MNLNMEMTKYKLGDLCKEFHSGKGILAAEISDSGRYPVYGGNGLRGYTDRYNQDGSYLIIGRQGAYCGNVRYNVGKAFLTEHAIVGQTKNEHNAIYLAFKLSLMNLAQFQGQSAQPGLSVDTLSKIELLMPSRYEQDKIAKILVDLDDKIALNKKMNQKLEAMAKRLYDYWFVQYDFPDKNGHPYKTTGGPMTYNPTLKREIPAGWEVKSLFDCSDVLYGFPYATEPFDEENLDASTKPYPVIRIRDIKDNTISAKTTEAVDDKYRTIVNDLLIGMDGYFHMSFWPRNDDYVNQRITRIRQKELSVMIIYHQIAPFIKFKEDQAKGSTVGHLSDKDMKQINILVPNNPRLSEKFDSILNLITKNKQEIYRLTKLRDKLLPLLMNGQVAVA